MRTGHPWGSNYLHKKLHKYRHLFKKSTISATNARRDGVAKDWSI
jgi:hypothetical protein